MESSESPRGTARYARGLAASRAIARRAMAAPELLEVARHQMRGRAVTTNGEGAACRTRYGDCVRRAERDHAEQAANGGDGSVPSFESAPPNAAQPEAFGAETFTRPHPSPRTVQLARDCEARYCSTSPKPRERNARRSARDERFRAAAKVRCVEIGASTRGRPHLGIS